MKKLFAPCPTPMCTDVALLVLRVVAGIAMATHGWGKIQNPFAWMGEGAAVPGIFQALAAVSEFAGAIAVALGLVTRLAGLGLSFTMLGAALFHMVVLKDPFVSTGQGGSYEMATLYLLIYGLLTVHGPGRLSLDAKLFGECRK